MSGSFIAPFFFSPCDDRRQFSFIERTSGLAGSSRPKSQKRFNSSLILKESKNMVPCKETKNIIIVFWGVKYSGILPNFVWCGPITVNILGLALMQ